MQPIAIHHLKQSGIEAHMMGDYVAVCWNTCGEKKELKGDDGLTYTTTVQVRRPDFRGVIEPYINFIAIRTDSNDGSPYRDEDSPVAGGINASVAEQVAKELLLAVEYMTFSFTEPAERLCQP